MISEPLIQTNCLFDTIGHTYDETRRADRKIVSQLSSLLKQESNRRYLDVGCGSGNYTYALSTFGFEIEGVDSSFEMLSKARKKYPHLLFHSGDAMSLLFKDEQFFGLLYFLSIHHFSDCFKAFQEAYRVLEHGGKIVIFTVTPEQLMHYWLVYYFPNAMAQRSSSLLSFKNLEFFLKEAGFHSIEPVLFHVDYEMEDLFLHSGKHKPQLYLDPLVRRNMSFFSSPCHENEFEIGLKHLRNDILSGEINEIIARYDHNQGDCLFISAQK